MSDCPSTGQLLIWAHMSFNRGDMMKDNAKPRGMLELWIHHKGKLLTYYKSENMVVNLGKTCLAHLLGGDTANRSVTTIAFGTNADGPYPTDDVSAITDIVTMPVTPSYPDATSVQFNFSVRVTDMNGMDIRTFGLLTADNTLVCRKTRGILIKDSSLSFDGRWTITF